MLAVHEANAAVASTNESAFNSNLGYSGEQWDASLRMQNLRARAYDPANGRFIGLDPFAGNMQGPQSLHKYAYVHGEPVQGIDPTGKFFGVASIIGLVGAFAGGKLAETKYNSKVVVRGAAVIGFITAFFAVKAVNYMIWGRYSSVWKIKTYQNRVLRHIYVKKSGSET